MSTEIVAVDRDAVSVVSMLENAKSWLATAVETRGPTEIAAAKAHIVTAETWAHELGLSKEIQQDAAEMVRRAEYSLDRAIRIAKAEGQINKTGPRKSYTRDGKQVNVDRDLEPITISARALFGGNAEARSDAYQMGGVEPEQFEEVIIEAKSEGNLSRANVVRKVKKQDGAISRPGPQGRKQRADIIRAMAAEGYSSRQMPAKVGVAEGTVRQIARDFDIDIHADKFIVNLRRIDSADVVRRIVEGLEITSATVDLINWGAVDSAMAEEWLSSLKTSLSRLKGFHDRIKELNQQ